MLIETIMLLFCGQLASLAGLAPTHGARQRGEHPETTRETQRAPRATRAPESPRDLSFSAAVFMLSCCVLLHFAVFLLLFGSMSCCLGLFSLLFVVFPCFLQPFLLFFLFFCCIFAAFPLLFEVCPGVVVLGPFWLPFWASCFASFRSKTLCFYN